MPSGSSTTASATANLTGGQTLDHITVSTTADGSGTLTITNSQGTPLYSNPKAGAAYVWEFGTAHLPIVLVQGSQFYCGNGGCQYQAYTWDNATQQFAHVAPPTQTAYQFNASSHQFTAVQVPSLQGLFGFIQVQGNQLDLVGKLYDDWNHAVVTPLKYVVAGTKPGTVQLSNQENYEPTGAMHIPITTPLMALEAFFQARALDLPLQGEPLLAQSNQSTVWSATAAVTKFGPTVFFPDTNPSVKTTPSGADITMPLVGYVASPSSPETTIGEYSVTASLAKTGSTYVLTQASLSPVALKAATSTDVLNLLANDSAFIQAQSKYSGWDFEVNPIGPSWQVDAQEPSPASGTAPAFKTLFTVNAETGAVSPAP